MGALWIAKGPRFLQDENFDGCSMGSQGYKISSGGSFDEHSMGSQGFKVSSRRKLRL